MKQFLKELISSNNEASSKRYAALFTLVNVILLAWVSTVNSVNHMVPEFIFDGLLLLVGGGLGLTVIEKIFNKTKQ
jgi:hypothetical protein